jgi:hypothetical protein
VPRADAAAFTRPVANSASKTQRIKKRSIVAFGCCIPSQQSAVEHYCGATAKWSVSDSARQDSSPSLKDCSAVAKDKDAAATVSACCAESGLGTAVNIVADDSPTSLLQAVKAPVEVRQWPRLERALLMYRQRALASDHRQKPSHLNIEPLCAAMDSASNFKSSPDSISSSACSEGGAATGKSQSLALLGFSDSRIRYVEMTAV